MPLSKFLKVLLAFELGFRSLFVQLCCLLLLTFGFEEKLEVGGTAGAFELEVCYLALARVTVLMSAWRLLKVFTFFVTDWTEKCHHFTINF